MRAMLIMTFCALFCVGCAAGSATAGYALKAGTADDVSSQCKERIINETLARIK